MNVVAETALTVQWENVKLKERLDGGSFTFQVSKLFFPLNFSLGSPKLFGATLSNSLSERKHLHSIFLSMIGGFFLKGRQ
jgi:hypothetical protein